MDELLKNLDESVFTPELIQQVTELHESKINEIEMSYAQKLADMQQVMDERVSEIETKNKILAEDYASYCKEHYDKISAKYSEYVQSHYKELSEAYAEHVKNELIDRLSAYTDLVAETFIAENKINIDESVKVAKYTAMMEAFDAALVTAGVSISQIAEMAEQTKIQESETKEKSSVYLQSALDKTINENVKLKAELAKVKKDTLVESFTSKMSLTQQEKFRKVANIVDYKDLEDLKSKLSVVAENIIGASSLADKKVENINENKNSPIETVEESTSFKDQPSSTSYKRFF